MNKFPFYKQLDSMLCGAACLQMIFEYYKLKSSQLHINTYCNATSEGISLLGLSKAAETFGMHSFCCKISINECVTWPLPCILHWNQNHFVVLYKVKKGKKFYVADPGKGLVTYGLEEFKQHWISTKSNGEDKGIAMFLETTPAFFTYK